MRILIYTADEHLANTTWIPLLSKALPEAELYFWHKDDSQHKQAADYLIAWAPPKEIFEQQLCLKAIFNMGAGIDAILTQYQNHPELISKETLLVRLEDAGMSQQMVEYIVQAVLRYFRRIDDYQKQQSEHTWKLLKPYQHKDFTIGILGLGKLGMPVAEMLTRFGFPVRAWSRSSHQTHPEIQTFCGDDALDLFLSDVRVLINLLPLTPKTNQILNKNLFNKLQRGAYLINTARGKHLVETDLLTCLDEGQLAGATLDVFQTEPLPKHHPFWNHPNISLTPHASALTQYEESLLQIAAKIQALQQGKNITGVVDWDKGY